MDETLTDRTQANRPLTLRLASQEDAAPLAALKLATFRATFLDGFAIPYPPADLAVFEAESYGLAKVTAELADPTHITWVAQDATGALVGYVHIGPGKLPHPDFVDGDYELYQLYLDTSVQGAGLGKRLLDLALERLYAQGRPVWIGVWSGNDRARALYASRGFEDVGEYQFAVGDWRDDEVIMRRLPPFPYLPSVPLPAYAGVKA